jgi:hypothetical protein
MNKLDLVRLVPVRIQVEIQSLPVEGESSQIHRGFGFSSKVILVDHGPVGPHGDCHVANLSIADSVREFDVWSPPLKNLLDGERPLIEPGGGTRGLPRREVFSRVPEVGRIVRLSGIVPLHVDRSVEIDGFVLLADVCDVENVKTNLHLERTVGFRKGSQLVGVEGLSLAGSCNAQKSCEQPEFGFRPVLPNRCHRSRTLPGRTANRGKSMHFRKKLEAHFLNRHGGHRWHGHRRLQQLDGFVLGTSSQVGVQEVPP